MSDYAPELQPTPLDLRDADDAELLAVVRDLRLLAEGDVGSPYAGDYRGDGLPFCEEWFYTVTRHVNRNMDMECPTHEDPLPGECNVPGRHDGAAIARLLNAVPALVARIDELEATS